MKRIGNGITKKRRLFEMFESEEMKYFYFQVNKKVRSNFERPIFP